MPDPSDGSVAIYRSTDPHVAGCAEARLWGSVLEPPPLRGARSHVRTLRVLLGPASKLPSSRGCGWRGWALTRLISHFPGTTVHAAPATSCPPTATFSGSRQKGQCDPCPRSVLAGKARFRPVTTCRPSCLRWLSTTLTVKDSSRNVCEKVHDFLRPWQVLTTRRLLSLISLRRLAREAGSLLARGRAGALQAVRCGSP